jgi:hypothetical protein
MSTLKVKADDAAAAYREEIRATVAKCKEVRAVCFFSVTRSHVLDYTR